MGTSRRHPVASILFPAARLAVLNLLFSDPDRQYHVNEILRAARIGRGAVQRELQRLTVAELLTRSKRANLVLYQANRSSPIYPDILAIINKTTGVAGTLKVALEPIRNKINVAFIYGSIAKGAERSGSDVDLMIIGTASMREVVAAIHSTQVTLGREINPTTFTKREFRSKVRASDPFLSRVLAQPRLPIFGDVDESGNLAA